LKPEYHRRITTKALESHVSPVALDAIIAANLGQDALRYQWGHDYYHYDNNAFAASDAYVEEQRQVTRQSLAKAIPVLAWQAFGRLTHTVQDFYAHSNYVALWREQHPGRASDEIVPLPGDGPTATRLFSGRLYYPLEVLSFVPTLGRLITFLLPRDAHAWMNKDDPSRPDFNLAYIAAVKRTVIEFQKLTQSLTVEQADLFRDKA